MAGNQNASSIFNPEVCKSFIDGTLQRILLLHRRISSYCCKKQYSSVSMVEGNASVSEQFILCSGVQTCDNLRESFETIEKRNHSLFAMVMIIQCTIVILRSSLALF